MIEKIVSKGFKIRIYPTDEQKTIIEKTFGCCRFIYNNYLQEKNEFYIEHKSELKGKTKEEKANEKEQILAKRRKHNMKLYPIYIMMGFDLLFFYEDFFLSSIIFVFLLLLFYLLVFLSSFL